MKTTIYRTGKMSSAVHGEDVLRHWAEFDVRRPATHVSRQEALFSAPDLQGAHVWLNCFAIRASRFDSPKIVFNEITVESDNIRVYCVEDYEAVGSHYGNPTSEQIAHIYNYWNNSMTLTQWIAEVGEDPHGVWEVLLPDHEIISSRMIAYPELHDMYEDWGMDDERLEDLEVNVLPMMKTISENLFPSLQTVLG